MTSARTPEAYSSAATIGPASMTGSPGPGFQKRFL